MTTRNDINNHRVTEDVDIYVERNGVCIRATFEVKVRVLRSESQPGLREWSHEVEERYPIYVGYGDDFGRELEWRYGENMPTRIVNALEGLEGLIASEIERKVQQYRI